MHKTLVLRVKRRPAGSSAPEWEKEPLGAGLLGGQGELGLRFRHWGGRNLRAAQPLPGILGGPTPRRTHLGAGRASPIPSPRRGLRP